MVWLRGGHGVISFQERLIVGLPNNLLNVMSTFKPKMLQGTRFPDEPKFSREHMPYPFFISSDLNRLADVLVGHKDRLNLNTLYSLCLLSESFVMSGKIILPHAAYNYFRAWEDRFCTNIDSLFIDSSIADDVCPSIREIKLNSECNERSILERGAYLDKRKACLGERGAYLDKRKACLGERKAYLDKRKACLAARGAAIEEKPAFIGDQQDLDELQAYAGELRALTDELQAYAGELRALTDELEAYGGELETLTDELRTSIEQGELLFGHAINYSDDRVSTLSKILNSSGIPINLLPDLSLACNIENNYNAKDIYAYKEVLRLHQLSFENIEKVTGLNSIYIPPIFSLVLDKSANIEDIPRAMVSVKEEFSGITELHNRYRAELINAKNLKEQHEILEDYLNSEKILGQKLTFMTRNKSLVRYFLDIFKSFNPLSIAGETCKAILNYDEVRVSLARVNRYVDLYDQVLKSRPTYKNIQRLFGDVEFCKKDIESAKLFLKI